MGDVAENNSSAYQEQTFASPDTNTTEERFSSAGENNQSQKKAYEPRDDLAAAGGFFTMGLYLSYFPIDAHLPALQGLFQFLAYCCYAIGFLGGMFGLSKLSRNQFFETFGIGAFLAVVAYGLHWAANALQWMPIVPIILRLLLIPFIGFAGYGVVRGISYLLMREEAEPGQLKENLKPEHVVGIIIAILSLVAAVIQALPALLPMIKHLLQIP